MTEAVVGVCKVPTASPFLKKGGEVTENLNRCIILNILGNSTEWDQRSKEERQETSAATYSSLTLVLLVPPPPLFFSLFLTELHGWQAWRAHSYFLLNPFKSCYLILQQFMLRWGSGVTEHVVVYGSRNGWMFTPLVFDEFTSDAMGLCHSPEISTRTI